MAYRFHADAIVEGREPKRVAQETQRKRRLAKARKTEPRKERPFSLCFTARIVYAPRFHGSATSIRKVRDRRMKGRLFIAARLARAAVITLVLAACASQAGNRGTVISGPLSIEKQGAIFASGRGILPDTRSTPANDAATGTVTIDQMYVYDRVPVRVMPLSLTLVIGQGSAFTFMRSMEAG